MLNLPKGQAFCLLEGGKLYKLRMPLPQQTESNVPKNIASLVNAMRIKKQNEAKHEPLSE